MFKIKSVVCLCASKSSASCDDGYIDCGPLATSTRKSCDSRPSTEKRESAPLLSKAGAACVENTVENLVEDPADGLPPAMYHCLSRSCSIGSQLSAAASSTIHEESFHDLSPEPVNSYPEYLPMCRLGVQKDDGCVPVPVTTAPSASRCSDEKSPLIGGAFSRGDASGNYVLPNSGPFSVHLDSVPPPSGHRNTANNDGYLAFRAIPVTSVGDDQNFGGSLERLGPPPEVPTNSPDCIIPLLPPKQHTSSGLRANSLLLSSKPRIIDRRRSSADSRGSVSGPAVPLRENRESSSASISTASAGFSARPATERRASRKPNLTVDAVASANFVYSGEFY